mgnify:CR=1 FL=1
MVQNARRENPLARLIRGGFAELGDFIEEVHAEQHAEQREDDDAMEIPEENLISVCQAEESFLVNCVPACSNCHANDASLDPADRHKLIKLHKLDTLLSTHTFSEAEPGVVYSEFASEKNRWRCTEMCPTDCPIEQQTKQNMHALLRKYQNIKQAAIVSGNKKLVRE